VFYTADTSLPQTYTAQGSGNNVAAIPIPAGAGTITFDITESGLGGNQAAPGFLQTGAATALLIGPGNTPTFDAYNAPTGPDFYSSVYGPGAADTSGNSQGPYLTLVLVKTRTVQVGSDGAGGGIVITAVNPAHTPVATTQPYAVADTAGNKFAAGYTGPVTAFNPVNTAPGTFLPEVAHNTTGLNSFTTNPAGFPGLQYWIGADSIVHITGCFQNPSAGGPLNTTFFTLPGAYAPASTRYFLAPSQLGLTGAPDSMTVGIDPSGNMQLHKIPAGTTLPANAVWFLEAHYPSKSVPNAH
jgi:hypothetical protein